MFCAARAALLWLSDRPFFVPFSSSGLGGPGTAEEDEEDEEMVDMLRLRPSGRGGKRKTLFGADEGQKMKNGSKNEIKE